MEVSQKKFEKEEEKFIPKPQPKKVKKVEPDDEHIDTNFDAGDLAMYGATLSEQLDTQTPGEEKFTPSDITKFIVSKEEKLKKEKLKKERAKKAE